MLRPGWPDYRVGCSAGQNHDQGRFSFCVGAVLGVHFDDAKECERADLKELVCSNQTSRRRTAVLNPARQAPCHRHGFSHTSPSRCRGRRGDPWPARRCQGAAVGCNSGYLAGPRRALPLRRPGERLHLAPGAESLALRPCRADARGRVADPEAAPRHRGASTRLVPPGADGLRHACLTRLLHRLRHPGPVAATRAAGELGDHLHHRPALHTAAGRWGTRRPDASAQSGPSLALEPGGSGLEQRLSSLECRRQALRRPSGARPPGPGGRALRVPADPAHALQHLALAGGGRER